MRFNAKLRPNYSSVNVSIVAVAFRQQIKKTAISGNIVGFLEFGGKTQQLVWKRSQKSN